MPPKRVVTNNTTKKSTKTTVKPATKPNKSGPVKKTSGTKVQTKKQPVKKGPSKEDLAAIKIQKCVRGFLGKLRYQKAQQAKIDYEKEMEELEKQAYLEIVKREQEEAEKRDERERLQRQKIQRAKKRQKVVLEAAFDDEVSDIEKCIKEAVNELDDPNNLAWKQKETKNLIEARDANDNSPLGEAGAGGANESVEFLIKNGANPNHQGQWGRTPLYRAAFAGHTDTVKILLESGADPRICAKDSNTPRDAAGTKEVQEVLDSWDISKTLEKLTIYEENFKQFKDLQRQEMAKEVGGIENEVADKKKIFETYKKELNTAYKEYEKRIFEHDMAVQEGFEKPELTIAAINDAEMHLESCKIKMEKAQQDLAQIHLKLREQQHKQAHLENDDGSEFDYDGGDNKLITRVNLQEITDVLFKDVGNKIKESGKWPLLMDSGGQATLFLRYRDTNMVNVLDTRGCEPNKLREMILGSIRYGKPFIIDLGNMDLWDAMVAAIERIQEGLFSQLITKALLENQNYMKLVDEKRDKPEYHPSKFVHGFADKFCFVVLTKMSYPPEEWIDNLYAIQIIVNKK